MPHSLGIPWAPRLILVGRTFRLPIQSPSAEVEVQLGEFTERGRRWSEGDRVLYLYLEAPGSGGICTVQVRCGAEETSVAIEVRTLQELRQSFEYNGATWPRRWPLAQPWRTTKTAQSLQDFPTAAPPSDAALTFWLECDDETLWSQLPPAELPRAHFVNVHEGCPSCGTAIFTYNGFYPWGRSHLPADYRSSCPACGSIFPANDIAAGDFTGSGDDLVVDDGYGYSDTEGHLFLFTATYCRDQTRAFGAGIDLLTRHVRTRGLGDDLEATTRLGLMLLRYAIEEIYLAAVPQFRYGPTLGVETPWEWGQTDWGAAGDPVAALRRMGTVRYCIDTPYISETLALAYDTLWPFLQQSEELGCRARALGAPVGGPGDAVTLVEEMLACLLQVHLDRGASSNLPRESQGVLVLLRALQRPDAAEVMTWLYDRGPDKLRVFTTNDFFPDGTPPESTGGYNNIHTSGLFALEHHLRQLRRDLPDAYPEDTYPSLVAEPRAVRIIHAPHEIAMVGGAYFQFGDGGSAAQAGPLPEGASHAPLPAEVLEWAAAYTGDTSVLKLQHEIAEGRHRPQGNTVHDGVGIAILRTRQTPERAALGIAYGDATGHRHADLLDVQLYAHGHPFLTDLGYPQSWATHAQWEGHWATHNTVWGAVADAGADPPRGRGRLVRTLSCEGIQVLEAMAQRWTQDPKSGHWEPVGVHFRRLAALVETDNQTIAVIDLTRVRGGDEHWRMCRGLEGDFHATDVAQTPQPGTVANPEAGRGQTQAISHPDHVGLAWMDEVARLQTGPAWQGGWSFHADQGVHLDLHQVRATAGTRVMSARATAIMGCPEESTYCYRSLLWKRCPASEEEATCVDLVLEPRRDGEPTIAAARAIAAQSCPEAVGVEIATRGGRQIRLYWSPVAGPGEETAYEDGTRMTGPLCVATERDIVTVGVAALQLDSTSRAFVNAVQSGHITDLDRQACTIEAEGLSNVAIGDRIRINPQGRGRNYEVRHVAQVGPGRLRLGLDLTSTLGRGRVLAVDGVRVDLEYALMTRTGYLIGARLESEDGGECGQISQACNPDTDHTTAWLSVPPNRLREGDWVRAVDYTVGDPIAFEPQISS